MGTDSRKPSAGSTPASTAGPGHHRIVSLEVFGGGFLEGLKMDFADGFNAVIGGRGTGKSTQLAFLRHGTGLGPDAHVNPSGAKALQSLVESNLQGGQIRITVETKHGMRYVAERGAKESVQVLNENNEAVAISFQTDNVFGIDFYSQEDIEQIAKSPRRQLALLDKPVEDDMRRIEADIRKLDRDLTQSATDLIRLQHEVRDLTEVAAEAPAVEEKLRGARQAAGPDAKAVNTAHARRALREKERAAVDSLGTDLLRVEKDLEVTVSALRRRLESRLDTDMTESPHEALLTKVRDAVVEVTRILDRAAVKVKEQCVTSGTQLEGYQKTLADLHAKEEAEYRALLIKSKEESGRAVERQRLEQRHVEVGTAKKDLELRKAELRRVGVHRRELLGRLSDLRNKRFALRQMVAQQLTEALQPTIRVSVTRNGGLKAYCSLLHEGLKGGQVKYGKMITRISEAATPGELCDLVQRGDVEAIAEMVNTDTDKARHIVDSLRNTELVFRIETVELEDIPRIELLHGSKYKDSNKVSDGQRSTAILPIVLLESERPLIIDEPEGHLDNRFIYQTVVKTLNVIKKKRQIIFVTHNGNIVVLGDAARVFVMDCDGEKASLEKFGTVDHCKEEIEALLEGGMEAFMLRKERYGH